MDLPLESAQTAILSESINQAVPIDGGGLQTNYHITQLHGLQCRHDSLSQQFSTTQVVLYGKTGMFAAVWFHQIDNIVSTAHINANE